MTERNDSRRGGTYISENRFAVAIVCVSVLVGFVLVALYYNNLLAVLVPVGGPTADAIPLYLFLFVFAIALVVWSWSRLLSFFE